MSTPARRPRKGPTIHRIDGARHWRSALDQYLTLLQLANITPAQILKATKVSLSKRRKPRPLVVPTIEAMEYSRILTHWQEVPKYLDDHGKARDLSLQDGGLTFATLVKDALPGTDPVHKVTIIPRGRALGVTMQLPTEDRYSQDRIRLLSTIAVLFGGRIAEEVFMNQMTTGASNDFQRATDLARRMVTQWGMSDSLGTMVYGEEEGEIFLGRSITTHKNVSEATMQQVDAEVRRIIDEQYARARKLIEDNRDKIEAMTAALLEWETIDADQINDIMEGKPPRPPKPSSAPPKSPAGNNTPGAEPNAAAPA